MQLNQGAISADTYARSIASIDMDTLKRQLDGNRISLIEYDRQLISVSSKLEAGSAFRTGAQDYIQSIGTLAQSVASGVTTVFKSLEDGLVEMLEQGAFDMQKFTKIIISEINRIIIRATIMRAVAGIATGGGGGIQHAFGSMDTAGTRSGEVSLTAAQGMAFDNGVQKFAKGGVVGSPTLFRHSGGTGLMGEAGPEAIAPLRRTKSGDLGIQSTTPNVTVNVINNTPDTETTQVERKGKDGSKILDVIITQKVKEAFAKGAFDTSLKTQYGINRRGA
jgi:lambda family phage tail tape measure protein